MTHRPSGGAGIEGGHLTVDAAVLRTLRCSLCANIPTRSYALNLSLHSAEQK